MTKEQFSNFLGIVLIPEILDLIVKKNKVSEKVAVFDFYESNVYRFLEDEKSKFWHYSPLLLYTLFNEEKKTGSFNFPEGT